MRLKMLDNRCSKIIDGDLQFFLNGKEVIFIKDLLIFDYGKKLLSSVIDLNKTVKEEWVLDGDSEIVFFSEGFCFKTIRDVFLQIRRLYPCDSIEGKVYLKFCETIETLFKKITPKTYEKELNIG